MEASPKFQLTNNTVAVKVSLNDDIRRFTFDGDYSALCREIGSMFQLGPHASFTLKYKDDDEDLVTLCNDRDLAEAKRVCSSALRLNVLLSSTAPTATTSVTEIVKAKAKPADKKEAKAAAKAEKKEQKKSLKEAKEKKEDKHHEKPAKEPKKALEEAKKEPKPEEKELSKEERQQRKEQKRVLKEAKEAAKEQKRQEKDQKKALKEAKKSDQKPPKAKLEARFVKDITLEDGTEVLPGASLVKTWRFRNEGNKSWPAGSKLIFVSKLKGDIMGAPEEVLAPIAEPGAEVDVSVPMVAPTAPGRYVGFWRLCTPEGKKFGQRVRVLVYVPSASSSSSDSSTTEEEARKKKKEAKQKHHHKEAAVVAAELAPELQDKVVQLEKLGFTNKKRNLKLLQKFGGDLSAVVNRLVLRQQKEKKLRETPKKKNDDM